MTRRVSRPGDDEGVTALMRAVEACDILRARRLLSAGEDVHARDKNGRNVLYHAFTTSHKTDKVVAIFQLLGEHGLDFNCTLDTDGCSALITAVTLDWVEVVQLLLGLGADVHDQGMPKFGASVSTDRAMAHGYYVSSAADSPNNTNQAAVDQDRFVFSKGCSQSVSPLLAATMLRKHAIADLLLLGGADCLQTSLGSFWKSSNVGACSVCDLRISPVHAAAYLGDAALLQRLLVECGQRCLQGNGDLSKSLAVWRGPEEDVTALWLALLRGETDCVKLLLRFDWPTAPPFHFGTGLFVGLEEGHYDNARMLLRSGYDLNEDLEWMESEQRPTEDADMLELISDLLAQPPSLLRSCRDTLRLHMGPRMPAYLATLRIPQKVADILMLKDVLTCDDLPASTDDVALTVQGGSGFFSPPTPPQGHALMF